MALYTQPAATEKDSKEFLSVNEMKVDASSVKKKFQCDLCSCSYSHKFVLSQHIKRTHSKETPFKCRLCPFAAVIKSELTWHMRKHGIYDRTYPCRYCDQLFKTSKHRREHESYHTGDLYTCDICEKSFAVKSVYKTHIKSHTKAKCKFCERKFHNLELLKKHQDSHVGHDSVVPRRYRFSNGLHFIQQCVLCNTDVGSLADLKIHILKKHSEVLGVNSTSKFPKWNAAGECPICSKTVKSKHVRFSHILRHVGILTYKCHLCDYKTSWTKSLRIHLLSHANKGQEWKCEPCQKTFTKRSQFTLHTKQHSEYNEINVHLCDMCGKRFSSRVCLKRHQIRCHFRPDEGKIYHCRPCELKFDDISELGVHTSLHQDQNYTCMICKQIFLSKENLHQHFDVHPQMLICHVCETSFDSYSLILKHRELCNLQRVCFLCEPETLIEHGDFITFHLKQNHPSECVECNLCESLFSSLHSYERHLASHFSLSDGRSRGVYAPTCDSEEEDMFQIGNNDQQSHSTLSDSSCPVVCECCICGAHFDSLQDLVDHEASHRSLLDRPKACPLERLKKQRVRRAWTRVKNIKIIVLDRTSYSIGPVVLTTKENNGSYLSPLFQSSNTYHGIHTFTKSHKSPKCENTRQLLSDYIYTNNNICHSKVSTTASKKDIKLTLSDPSSLEDLFQSSSNEVNTKVTSVYDSASSDSPNIATSGNKFIKSSDSDAMKSSRPKREPCASGDAQSLLGPLNKIDSESESDTSVSLEHREYVFNIRTGERKLKEKVVYKDGKKRVITEDCGFKALISIS